MNIINITKEIMKEIEYRDALTDAISFVSTHMEKVGNEENAAAAKATFEDRRKCKGCEDYETCKAEHNAEIEAQATAARKIVAALKEYKEAVEGGTPVNDTAEANRKE